jgi:hypothetical protein
MAAATLVEDGDGGKSSNLLFIPRHFGPEWADARFSDHIVRDEILALERERWPAHPTVEDLVRSAETLAEPCGAEQVATMPEVKPAHKSLGQFGYEGLCFGIGLALGAPWGPMMMIWCGIVAILWSRRTYLMFED